MKISLSGFTLVELLTVIAIISILTGVAISSFSAAGARNFSSQSSQISDILARAREYAVANNTYTWVAFYSNPPVGNQPPTLYMAILASVDGTSQILAAGNSQGSSLLWPTAPSPAVSGTYQLLDRVAFFPGIGIYTPGTYTVSSPNGPVSGASALATVASFPISIPSLGTENFATSVEFTPSGEAKVAAAQTQAIEFDLCQYHGPVASPTSYAVVQVNGFTGNAQVYLP